MPVLQITNLLKTFTTPDGQPLRVIDVPSFELAPAQHIGLRGESGSGKTTLLNLIAGILTPDAGSIRVDGVDLASLNEAGRDRVRAANVGYIFQTFNLLHGYTALENIELAMRFGGGVDRARAKALLERVGLADRMMFRPAQLSTGQQQRVAVARALANRPQLVLADEPTGNLDFRRAEEALELIREVCREFDAALMLVSHDREILGAFETVRDLSEINRVIAAAVVTANVN